VISARLAREYWGQADPIGAGLERVWGRDTPAGSLLSGTMRKPPGTRIVGIVEDVVTDLRSFGAPTIYLPLASSSVPRLVVRTRDDPHAVARGIQTAMETIDPGIRASITYAADGLQRDLMGPRTLAALSVTVGATALGLAVIGLFGVTAFLVEQRRHEVSVRKALGASSSQLMGLLFRDSLRPVAVGLTLGVLVSLVAGQVIQGVLYGVSSRDPISIVAAVGILVAAASAAVFLPARRAARVNPAELLKQS
jgi:predicted lysophospholipase L1 biosynthesis ABC-type transport system permease subunit